MKEELRRELLAEIRQVAEEIKGLMRRHPGEESPAGHHPPPDLDAETGDQDGGSEDGEDFTGRKGIRGMRGTQKNLPHYTFFWLRWSEKVKTFSPR